MTRQKFYITTPLYYVNDVPHLGHAYTTIASDSLARFKRLDGFEVFLLTGTDEHGQKIERASQGKNKKPQELADEVVVHFRDLWGKLNISYDDFIRTTEPRHEKAVQELFSILYRKGDIYRGVYEGDYCIPCERYVLPGESVEGKCPDCGRPTEKLKEETFFFKMSGYQKPLLDYLAAHPDFVQPPVRYNEIVSFIRGGLKDLSISRTNFRWGVPIPGEKDFVIYVWFDALINYITAAGFGSDEKKFGKWWPADVHLIGKDILKFHAVIWPAMLIAAGIKPPHKVFAHGWWTNNGEKMSKSKGNFINPLEIIEEFGTDALRYFILREVPFGQDGDFSREALIRRLNSDLANDFGNLIYRTLTMVEKYTGGEIPVPDKEETTAADLDLKERALKIIPQVREGLNNLAFNQVLELIWEFIRSVNKYIDSMSPWSLKKENRIERLQTVLYNFLESLRFIALFTVPFLPASGEGLWRQLGIKEDIWQSGFSSIEKWGGLKPGGRINKEAPLFPRIEQE